MKTNYINGEQDRRIECLENHIATLNNEMGEVKIAVSGIKTDVNWLKKSYWVIATASIGALMGAIINLLLK